MELSSKKKIVELQKQIDELRAIIAGYEKITNEAFKLIKSLNTENKHLKAAILSTDIDFPNSEERRPGDPDTPLNISDIFND